jgi:uncharacterized membrane protein
VQNHRHSALDVLRGLVIILMALDHTRAWTAPGGLSPEDLDKTTIPFFLCRWVTHLCAPTFVLLMGAGVGLRRKRKPDEMRSYLLSRGLWIVLLEITWVNFSFHWTMSRTSLGVLWALGGSMVILALFSRIPGRWLLACGVVLTVVLDLLRLRGGDIPVVGFTLAPHGFKILGHPVHASYALIPWLAVAMAGVGLGPWLTRARPQAIATTGGGMLLGFALLRGLHLGDPGTWESSSRGWMFTAADFLNPSKYPPSVDYILLTCGISLLILAGPARSTGPVARWLSMFGRVPLFFYLLHLPLAHGLGNAWSWVMHGSVSIPRTTELSIGLILAGWGLVVLILWPACAAWRRLKERRTDLKWLAYL